jgi:hypothetical protein
MRRHVFVFIAGLATTATLSLWPFATCAQQDAQVQGLLKRILRMQAEDAAAKIGQFIHEIEVQMDWVTAHPRTTSRLVLGEEVMRRVPAITELSLIDAEREPDMMVKLSRRADVPATSQAGNFPDQKSRIAIFGGVDAVGRSLIELAQTLEKRAHWGPIYFLHKREPYMTVMLTLPRTSGMSVAEINLKPIQDMLSRIKPSEHAQVNAIDAQGRLIFPEISLVLDNDNVTQLAQVRAARRASAGTGIGLVQSAKDSLGRDLLTAYAPVATLGWLVFVELPIEEMNALAQ